MSHLAIQYCPSGGHRAVRPLGICLDNAVEDFGGEIMVGCIVKEIAVIPPDHTVYCVAQARGAFTNRIENRLGIGRRTADDIEHFAGCRLMFESFGKLARASLFGFEQAYVLNRDHGLVCEGLKQFDLLLSERAWLLP